MSDGKKRTWKIWVAVVVGLLVVTAVLAGVKVMQIQTMIAAGKSFKPPPESVTTAKVEAGQWLASRPAIGTLVAIRSVTVAPEISGLVRELHFDSGSAVKAGQLLVKLDPSVEEAQLRSAVADQTLTHQALQRAERLRKSGSNTPAELEAAEARAAQAKATVDQLRVLIAKKTIKAPFAGRLGIRLAELGQVVAPGTPMVTLQSVDPIYAEFMLPQQTLADLQLGITARLTTDSFPDGKWEGQITTINSEVDASTRNVKVRATFPNADGRLRAGMFANVEVVSSDVHKVLIIPATAVLYAPYGDSVFIAEQGKAEAGKQAGLTAKQRFVRLGERRGDLVAVESGLQIGETVVASGAFKLRNGAQLVVKNDLLPKSDIAPKPVER